MIANVLTYLEGKKQVILVGFLWLLLWAGYNTGLYRLLADGFPRNLADFIHGIRALAPIGAGLMAVALMWFKKYRLSERFFLTPIGLLVVYFLTGLVSSFFSTNIPEAVYWALMYGSVLLVLLFLMSGVDAQERVLSAITVNWAVVAFLAFGLFAFFVFQTGLEKSLSLNALVCSSRPYESIGAIKAQADFLGMAGTRPTGLGRYAAAALILSLAAFMGARDKGKVAWAVLLVFFGFILMFSKARTAIVACTASLIFMQIVFKRYRVFLAVLSVLLLVSAASSVFYLIPCKGDVLAKLFSKPNLIPTAQQTVVAGGIGLDTKPVQSRFNSVLTLSGRINGIWGDAIRFFMGNPLIGKGFNADRIYLGGRHVHNTLLHPMVQAGLLGTVPFILAIVMTFVFSYRLFWGTLLGPREKIFLGGACAILVFMVVRGITESFAYYGADWLVLAPVIAYVQVLYFNKAQGKTV